MALSPMFDIYNPRFRSIQDYVPSKGTCNVSCLLVSVKVKLARKSVSIIALSFSIHFSSKTPPVFTVIAHCIFSQGRLLDLAVASLQAIKDILLTLHLCKERMCIKLHLSEDFNVPLTCYLTQAYAYTVIYLLP